MNWLVGLFRLFYDLIVGDSWALAAAVVVTLVAGAGLIRFGILSPTLIALFVALTLFLVAPLITIIEARVVNAGRRSRSGNQKDV